MKGHFVTILFLIFQAFLGLKVNGQNSLCDSLFNHFKRGVLIEQIDHVGQVVFGDETNEAFCLLMLSCEVEDLVPFLNDSIPLIRSEIFYGIAQKTSDLKLLKGLCNSHQWDTIVFHDYNGGLMIAQSVLQRMEAIVKFKECNSLRVIDYSSKLNDIRNSPKLVIPGAKFGRISKQALMDLDTLTCSLGDMKILSFTLISGKEFKSGSNILTKKMKRYLKQLQIGDKLYFSDVRVELSDGTYRNLGPVNLVVH